MVQSYDAFLQMTEIKDEPADQQKSNTNGVAISPPPPPPLRENENEEEKKKKKTVKKQICKFNLQNACRFADKCANEHVRAQRGVPSVQNAAKSAAVCKYFLVGKCKNSLECRFRHDDWEKEKKGREEEEVISVKEQVRGKQCNKQICITF